MGGRKGVVGEIIIIVALIASGFLIMQTFSEERDTPNVPRESIEGMRDVRTLLSEAVLQWLQSDVIEQPLACNGQYPIASNDSAFLEQLRPFIEGEINQYQQEDGAVTLEVGDLQSLSFEGLEGISITLANGTVIYNDSNIYSETATSQPFLFNVRLPLVMGVAQDWVQCDSGNISQHLKDEFGDACFYGVKSPSLPGGCPEDDGYSLTAANKNVIASNAVSIETVGRASQKSIAELNAYFNGTASCKSPLQPVDTGIVCTYELEDAQFYNKVNPFSSTRVATPVDFGGGIITWEALSAMPEELEFRDFIRADRRLYAIPARITTYAYSDQELASPPEIACNATGRVPVESVLPMITIPDEAGMIDLTEESNVSGSSAFYVNTTRGVKFTLVVTCRDTRASLLGEPLEYTFKVRHGIKQHCGPRFTAATSEQCMGCGLKPNFLDACQSPGAPRSCDDYYSICRDKTLWEEINQNGVGSASADVDALLLGNDELFSSVCRRCGAVRGTSGFLKIDECPPPPEALDPSLIDPVKAKNDKIYWCRNAHASMCCSLNGFNDTCSPAGSLSNPDCFTDQNLFIRYCVEPVGCPGDECNEKRCDAVLGCVQDRVKQSTCMQGCGSCQANAEGIGECVWDAPETPPYRSCHWRGMPGPDACNLELCDPANKRCSFLPKDPLPTTCGSSVCGRETCQPLGNGYSCQADDADRSQDGEVCDTDTDDPVATGDGGIRTCTTISKCNAGSCEAEPEDCVTIYPRENCDTARCQLTERGCECP